MTYADVPGWFDFERLYDEAADGLPDGAVAAEIGCWLGRSVIYLADRIIRSARRVTLYAVDHGFGSIGYDEGVQKDVLGEFNGQITGPFLKNLKSCGVYDAVATLAVPSVRAAALFPDRHFDFIFLDGDHRKEAVAEDLRAWWPKVKPGGRMAGHDYDRHWPSVVEAVNEFFGGPTPDPTCPHCWGRTKE